MNILKKGKLFIENFLVYGFGQIISKIIPFIMLPIVTRLMTDSYYMGINDIVVVVVSFASQIAIMGMGDAMFRLFFDKENLDYRKKVCSTALLNVIIISFTMFLILIVFNNDFSKLFFGENDLGLLIIICAVDVLVLSLNSIISAPTRMQNKRKIFLIVNTISPLIGYCISIPLLINKQYLIALPLGSMISSILIFFVFIILNIKWFKFKMYDKSIAKELFKIGIPLLPTFLIYWIFSSLDRIMISKILGNSEVGIYAVGNKLASASQLIYAAFAGGWSYFAFSTMKEDKQIETVSKVFEYLALIAFTAFMFITPFTRFIFELVFEGEYIRGYKVFPYLFLSPLILMLFQTSSSQFLIIKKSWYCTLTLIIGALLNIILNYILIPTIGIQGAAIATLIGYSISVLTSILVLNRKKLIMFSKKIFVCIIFVIIELIFQLFEINILYQLLLLLLYFIINIFNYKMDLTLVFTKIKLIFNKGAK